MAILLAPMEGLLDFVLRDILTRVGGVDRCVSEFIRITHTLLPERVFFRSVPELRNGGRTLAGVPVRVQLLGSDPQCVAENAARLATLGPEGIDLNFGCPAKVVNRHRGGAALLDEPELILKIVAAVCRAVPPDMPVSAKMRLGVTDDSRALECALAIESGGAVEIVVHARTRADAYRPPAYWGRVADIRQAVGIPVVANGEIWTVQDALRCRVVSGCDHLMLGRGMVANPGLALSVKSALDGRRPGEPRLRGTLIEGACADSGPTHSELSWHHLFPHLVEFWRLVIAHLEVRQQAGRLKQWLNLLRRHYPEAQRAYDEVRGIHDPALIDRWFAATSISAD